MVRGILFCSILAFAAPLLAETPVDFSRDILPILSDKCYHCHGPDEQARKAELRFSNMSEAPDLMFVEWEGGISSLLEHAGAREVVVHPAVRKRSSLMRPSSNAPGDLVSIRIAWE